MLRASLAIHLAPAALLASVGAGCAEGQAGGAQPLGSSSSPVVYGTDSRREFFEPASEALRRLARSSTLAVLRRSSLDGADPESVRVVAPSLGEARGLCEAERFVDQPSAAVCSGVLIDEDLLLVAGHCIEGEFSCQDLLFVAGYYYDAPGELNRIRQEDVFACRRLAYWQPGRERGDGALDAAVVQLDRPVRAPLLPAVLAADVPLPGAPVTAIGYGEGLPGKLDVEGKWLGPGAPDDGRAEAQVDAFAGFSGGGVFDARRELTGIVVSGRQDYEVSEQGCLTVHVEPQAAAKGEGIVLAGRAVQALCEDGWPSERLCGDAGVCEDSICALGEEVTTCPADCGAADCGDGRCEAGEWRTCSLDCGPTPPGHWVCSSLWYGEGGQCDCGCGAPDPDCLAGECDPQPESVPDEGVAPGAPARDDGGCSVGGATRSSTGRVLTGIALLALLLARRALSPWSRTSSTTSQASGRSRCGCCRASPRRDRSSGGRRCSRASCCRSRRGRACSRRPRGSSSGSPPTGSGGALTRRAAVVVQGACVDAVDEARRRPGGARAAVGPLWPGPPRMRLGPWLAVNLEEELDAEGRGDSPDAEASPRAFPFLRWGEHELCLVGTLDQDQDLSVDPRGFVFLGDREIGQLSCLAQTVLGMLEKTAFVDERANGWGQARCAHRGPRSRGRLRGAGAHNARR